MNSIEAEQIVADLTEDQRADLLMHLAEQFNFTIFDADGDVTYFLSMIPR